MAFESHKAHPGISYVDGRCKGIFNVVIERLRFQRKLLSSAE